MLQKPLALSAIYVLVITNTYGQSDINTLNQGAFVDLTGQTIDGHFDYTYNPKNKTTCELVVGEVYTPGYYYDKQNKKIVGKLKYSQSNNYFRFSTNGEKESEKIKPENCLGYVIGNDTFAVIKDFNVERAIGPIFNENEDFAEVITTIKDLTFYQHTRIGSNNIVTTFHVRKGDSGKLISFPKGKDLFNTVALTYFGDIPYLRNKIENNTYTSDNLIELVKYLEYWTNYQAKAKILFTNSWEETKDTSKMAFYANITNVAQELWTLRYYKSDGTLLYEGQYNELSPMKKTNIFTFYYPDGTVRKRIPYTDNIPEGTIKEYFTNGKPHYYYTLSKKQKQKFEQVLDPNGNSVLDDSGNGIEKLYDSIQNREITRTFSKYELVSSSYSSPTGKTVYQFCKGIGVKATNLAAEQIDLKYPESSISMYNHGMVVVKILVDETGKTTSYRLLKGVDNAIDKQTIKYCESTLNDKAWLPLKVDKKPVEQEIILSFLFELQGFSRYRNNYYYNNMFMHQMMMQNQQQMMMQNISAPRF